MKNYNFEWLNLKEEQMPKRVIRREPFVTINPILGRFYISARASYLLNTILKQDAKAIEIGLDLENKALAIKPIANHTPLSINVYAKSKGNVRSKTFNNMTLIDRIKEIIQKTPERYPVSVQKDSLIIDLNWEDLQ